MPEPAKLRVGSARTSNALVMHLAASTTIDVDELDVRACSGEWTTVTDDGEELPAIRWRRIGNHAMFRDP